MSDTIVIDGEVELLNVIDGDPDVFIGGGGSQPTGTKSILLTEAGKVTEDVTEYAYAEVNAVKSATASGAVASFSDGAEDVPMDSCVVNIEPVQSGSGDPSPSNVRPISGWSEVKVTRAGKNLYSTTLGEDLFNNNVGATHSNENGVLVINATSSSNSGCYSTGASAIKKLTSAYDGEYTYSFDIRASVNASVFCGYESKGVNVLSVTTDWQRITITATFNRANNSFVIYNRSGAQCTIYVRNFQFEAGSSATSYEPYVTPTEYPISLGQTVYGGTLDVVSGVLTVNRVKWTPVANGATAVTMSDGNSGYRFNNYQIGIAHDLTKTAQTISNYLVHSGNWVTPNSVCLSTSANTTAFFCLPSTLGITTHTAFNDWVTTNGVYVIFYLATPTTVQLTPTEVKTLLGSNSVWADSGSISVGYKADIFLYADSLETIVDTLTGGA